MSANPPVVLVTGATGALGRAVVRRFAADGARLALVGRNEDRLRRVADGSGLADDARMFALGELTDREAAQAVVDVVEARFGRIDVLVHLVGGWAGGTPVADLDPAELGRMLDQHLWTTLHVTQAAVPGMVERGFGRIVLLSSVAAYTGGIIGAHYASSKAGLHGLAHSLSQQAAGDGVTVNVVAPALIESDMLPADPGVRAQLAGSLPVGRLGTADEVADLIAAVVRNGFVTNQSFLVDGGRHPT